MAIQEILQEVRRLRALVIGDLILDHYVCGDASRISPEAPVPVVHVQRDSYVAGGAGNVAANVRSLGAQVEVWGWVGRDEAGRRLRGIFRTARIAFRPDVFTVPVPTIQKTRVLARNQQLCRLDREPPPADYPLSLSARLTPLLKTLRDIDVVIFSDYAKGFLTQEILDRIQRSARRTGTMLALDPKPRRPLRFHGLDLLTPNRREALELAGMADLDDDRFPEEAVCRAIWRRYAPRHLVITLGADGMLLSRRGQALRRIPTVAHKVFDVSGAGDTAIAALSLALAGGFPLEEAAHFANAAAGVVVGKVGTATVTPAELRSAAAAP